MPSVIRLITACVGFAALVGCADDPGSPEPAPPFFPRDGAVLVEDYEVSWTGSDLDSLVVHLDGVRHGAAAAAPFRVPVILVNHQPGSHVIEAHLHSAAGVDTVVAEVLMCHGVGHDVGNFVPERSLPDRLGQLHALHDPGPGRRFVLLDFWASWCGPCVVSLPETEAFLREYGPLGLKVLTVNAESRETVDGFMAANDYTFTVLQDENGLVSRSYGVYAIPAYYLVDTRGVVRYAGLGSGSGDEIEAAIRKLLELD